MAETEIIELPESRKEAREIGARFYFSNKACKAGHISARRTLDGHCIVCHREHTHRYAKANPDKRREGNRRYYSENKEKHLENGRNWSAANPEKTLEIKRKYREANREKLRASNREYQKANPGKMRARGLNRIARKLNAEGRHTAEDIATIRGAQRDKCACCGIKLKGAGHVDHIIALARGGSNWPNNLQILCQPCNQSKGARDPIEFMQSRGRLL